MSRGPTELDANTHTHTHTHTHDRLQSQELLTNMSPSMRAHCVVCVARARASPAADAGATARQPSLRLALRRPPRARRRMWMARIVLPGTTHSTSKTGLAHPLHTPHVPRA
eukprot:TRINITY_DN27222_c0_g1_i1.p1 TRINITY_DN27222_c0_g1~~TRINITY_DN27222_c0_g1_i1.p1  ORF type:complete len:111 (+),score=2.13 TRINITY_DN27222_c0_g1_i1:234-566(+)